MLRILIILLLASCQNMDYVSYDDLDYMNKSKIIKLTNLKSRNIAAFKYSEKADSDLLVVRQQKSKIRAETLLDNKKNKNYFMSLGVDHKKNSAELEFRVEF